MPFQPGNKVALGHKGGSGRPPSGKPGRVPVTLSISGKTFDLVRQAVELQAGRAVTDEETKSEIRRLSLAAISRVIGELE